MTENEAIERLKCMRLFMELEDKENKSKFLDSDYEANCMAIQALESKAVSKKLLEKAAEEIENLYGRETELTIKIRDFLKV